VQTKDENKFSGGIVQANSAPTSLKVAMNL
jgi:hypothetical protein